MRDRDVFRKEYKPLSNDQESYINSLKDYAELLLDLFNDTKYLNKNERYMALAKTNLEQAIMWAVKAVT